MVGQGYLPCSRPWLAAGDHQDAVRLHRLAEGHLMQKSFLAVMQKLWKITQDCIFHSFCITAKNDKMCAALRRFEWGMFFHCVTNSFHVIVKNKNMAGYRGVYSILQSFLRIIQTHDPKIVCEGVIWHVFQFNSIPKCLFIRYVNILGIWSPLWVYLTLHRLYIPYVIKILTSFHGTLKQVNRCDVQS